MEQGEAANSATSSFTGLVSGTRTEKGKEKGKARKLKLKEKENENKNENEKAQAKGKAKAQAKGKQMREQRSKGKLKAKSKGHGVSKRKKKGKKKHRANPFIDAQAEECDASEKEIEAREAADPPSDSELGEGMPGQINQDKSDDSTGFDPPKGSEVSESGTDEDDKDDRHLPDVSNLVDNEKEASDDEVRDQIHKFEQEEELQSAQKEAKDIEAHLSKLEKIEKDIRPELQTRPIQHFFTPQKKETKIDKFQKAQRGARSRKKKTITEDSPPRLDEKNGEGSGDNEVVVADIEKLTGELPGIEEKDKDKTHQKVAEQQDHKENKRELGDDALDKRAESPDLVEIAEPTERENRKGLEQPETMATNHTDQITVSKNTKEAKILEIQEAASSSPIPMQTKEASEEAPRVNSPETQKKDREKDPTAMEIEVQVETKQEKEEKEEKQTLAIQTTELTKDNKKDIEKDKRVCSSPESTRGFGGTEDESWPSLSQSTMGSEMDHENERSLQQLSISDKSPSPKTKDTTPPRPVLASAAKRTEASGEERELKEMKETKEEKKQDQPKEMREEKRNDKESLDSKHLPRGQQPLQRRPVVSILEEERKEIGGSRAQEQEQEQQEHEKAKENKKNKNQGAGGRIEIETGRIREKKINLDQQVTTSPQTGPRERGRAHDKQSSKQDHKERKQARSRKGQEPGRRSRPSVRAVASDEEEEREDDIQDEREDDREDDERQDIKLANWKDCNLNKFLEARPNFETLGSANFLFVDWGQQLKTLLLYYYSRTADFSLFASGCRAGVADIAPLVQEDSYLFMVQQIIIQEIKELEIICNEKELSQWGEFGNSTKTSPTRLGGSDDKLTLEQRQKELKDWLQNFCAQKRISILAVTERINEMAHIIVKRIPLTVPEISEMVSSHLPIQDVSWKALQVRNDRNKNFGSVIQSVRSYLSHLLIEWNPKTIRMGEEQSNFFDPREIRDKGRQNKLINLHNVTLAITTNRHWESKDSKDYSPQTHQGHNFDLLAKLNVSQRFCWWVRVHVMARFFSRVKRLVILDTHTVKQTAMDRCIKNFGFLRETKEGKEAKETKDTKDPPHLVMFFDPCFLRNDASSGFWLHWGSVKEIISQFKLKLLTPLSFMIEGFARAFLRKEAKDGYQMDDEEQDLEKFDQEKIKGSLVSKAQVQEALFNFTRASSYHTGGMDCEKMLVAFLSALLLRLSKNDTSEKKSRQKVERVLQACLKSRVDDPEFFSVYKSVEEKRFQALGDGTKVSPDVALVRYQLKKFQTYIKQVIHGEKGREKGARGFRQQEKEEAEILSWPLEIGHRRYSAIRRFKFERPPKQKTGGDGSDFGHRYGRSRYRNQRNDVDEDDGMETDVQKGLAENAARMDRPKAGVESVQDNPQQQQQQSVQNGVQGPEGKMLLLTGDTNPWKGSIRAQSIEQKFLQETLGPREWIHPYPSIPDWWIIPTMCLENEKGRNAIEMGRYWRETLKGYPGYLISDIRLSLVKSGNLFQSFSPFASSPQFISEKDAENKFQSKEADKPFWTKERQTEAIAKIQEINAYENDVLPRIVLSHGMVYFLTTALKIGNIVVPRGTTVMFLGTQLKHPTVPDYYDRAFSQQNSGGPMDDEGGVGEGAGSEMGVGGLGGVGGGGGEELETSTTGQYIRPPHPVDASGLDDSHWNAAEELLGKTQAENLKRMFRFCENKSDKEKPRFPWTERGITYMKSERNFWPMFVTQNGLSFPLKREHYYYYLGGEYGYIRASQYPLLYSPAINVLKTPPNLHLRLGDLSLIFHPTPHSSRSREMASDEERKETGEGKRKEGKKQPKEESVLQTENSYLLMYALRSLPGQKLQNFDIPTGWGTGKTEKKAEEEGGGATRSERKRKQLAHWVTESWLETSQKIQNLLFESPKT